MRLIIYIITTTFIICLSALIAFPSIINWNSYYGNYIVKKLEQMYENSTVRIGGNVTGSFILPKIIINNLYIEKKISQEDMNTDMIMVEKLELRPSFLSLIIFTPKIQEATLNNPQSNIKNLYNILSTKSKNSIKTVNIINGVINTGNDNTSPNNKVLHIKKGTIKTQNNKKNISGILKIGNNEYNVSSTINLHKSKIQDISLNVNSQIANLEFTTQNNNGEYQGKVSINGTNFSQFVNDITETNKTALLSSITSEEKFDISFDTLLSDKKLKINSIKIDSKSIQGTGEFDYQKKLLCNINLNFSKIDIDNLTQNTKNHHSQKESNILDYFSIILPKDLALNMQINTKEINYNNLLSSNLKIIIKMLNGGIEVQEISSKLPGSDNFINISGKISSNNIRSKFQGNMYAKGQDFDSLSTWILPIKISDEEHVKKSNKFSIESKIYIAPRIFSISNVNIATDEGNIKGAVRIKYSKKNSTIVGNINLNGINLSKYTTEIRSNSTLIQRLRNIKYDVNFNTNITNFTLQKRNVKKSSFSLNIMKGRLNIDNFIFDAQDGSDLQGNIQITINSQQIRPTFLVNINSKKYDSAFISLPKLTERLLGENNKINQIKWSTKKINLFGLENFDGNFNINIKELMTKSGSVKDFVINAQIKDGLMSINKFIFYTKAGFFVMNSNIGLGDEPSIAAVFSTSNIEIENILKNTLDLNNIKGVISISGILKTQGKSLLEWISNISGKLEFAARGVNVGGINLSSFISNLFISQSKSDIASLTQISLYNGSTFFESIDGKVKINKGISSLSSQFKINKANGALSANFSLVQFIANSLFRLYFIPPNQSSPVYIDMNLQGSIWQPKITFNIDALYDIVANNRKYQ